MEGTRKRAVVYTGTFRETYTDWFVNKSDIYLISQAILLMTEECGNSLPIIGCDTRFHT